MSTNSRSARNRNRASDNKCPMSSVFKCPMSSVFKYFVWEAIRKAFRYKVKTFARLMKCWRDFVVVFVVDMLSCVQRQKWATKRKKRRCFVFL
ncbi:unnamed protein product [Bathycoccus prasinos]